MLRSVYLTLVLCSAGAFRLTLLTLKVNIQLLLPLLYVAHMHHIAGINVGVLYIAWAFRLVGMVDHIYVLLKHYVLTGAFRPAYMVSNAYISFIILVSYVVDV